MVSVCIVSMCHIVFHDICDVSVILIKPMPFTKDSFI